jgi:Ca2+-binding EF-hand superfamily protein
MVEARQAAMVEIFKMFDKDGSNSIDVSEVSSLLISLGRSLKEDEVNNLIAECDKDDSGTIDMDEFMAYMDKFYSVDETTVEDVVEAFKFFDLDGNGYISYDEFKSILTKFGGQFSEKDVDMIFQYTDTNQDGKLSYAEFVDLWKYQ